jgi:NAD(P)H-hydrate epimerase
MQISPEPAFPEQRITREEMLELEAFRALDYEATIKYHIPIELMMENAGLNMARVIAVHAALGSNILVLAGKGNNGGGGLTTARRLACWGYNVSFYMPDPPGNDLVKNQLERALKCGVREIDQQQRMMHSAYLSQKDVVLDALLGFSQRLPLPIFYREIFRQVASLDCLKISLDLPTGIISDDHADRFPADIICSLAAPKKILFDKSGDSIIYLADLGIPRDIYDTKGLPFHIPFEKSSVFTLLSH